MNPLCAMFMPTSKTNILTQLNVLFFNGGKELVIFPLDFPKFHLVIGCYLAYVIFKSENTVSFSILLERLVKHRLQLQPEIGVIISEWSAKNGLKMQ